MTILQWQKTVDTWVKQYGVRYFDVMTNMLLLMEEIGEVARIVSRTYGEQSFKEILTTDEQKEKLSDEIADVFFVLTCLANQTGIDLEKVLKINLDKKTLRDKDRHRSNPRLQDPSV